MVIPVVIILGIFVFQFSSLKDANVVEWNKDIKDIEISSSKDKSTQKAYFYSSKETKPLIVSLHQWSATYDKNHDPISDMAIKEEWNYIRPDFRGKNNNPDACGSELVISDLDDAIRYAIDNGNVDTNQIHIIGASGGGHAALMHLMKSNIDITSYSVWVPITDFVAWYSESKIRDKSYKNDILACTNSKENLNVDEAKARSPLYLETPNQKLNDTKVQIFAGVNDGYDGAVPISHSINFYNKLVDDLLLSDDNKVPSDISEELLYTQQISETTDEKLGERAVLYKKETGNISLVIFDGGHEILDDEAFKLILNKNHAIH